jgi:hypothetical protein
MSRRLIGSIAIVVCGVATAGLSFAQSDQKSSGEPMQFDGGAFTSNLQGDAGANSAWDASAGSVLAPKPEAGNSR